jgi:hypothetical protein
MPRFEIAKKNEIGITEVDRRAPVPIRIMNVDADQRAGASAIACCPRVLTSSFRE